MQLLKYTVLAEVSKKCNVLINAVTKLFEPTRPENAKEAYM